MTKQGTLEAKHLESMNASEQAESSSCHHSKVTCEEFTPKNCSSENLAVPSKFGTDNLQSAQSRWNEPLSGQVSDRVSYTRDRDDVGCSSKSGLDRMSPDKQGSVDGTSDGDVAGRFNSGETSDLRKDVVCATKSELVDGNSPKNNCNEVEETGSLLASTNALVLSSSCTRTKMLTKSGNTQYFVKDTLKDKGTLCRGTAPCGEFLGQSYPEASSPNKVDTSAPLNSSRGVDLTEDASTYQNNLDSNALMLPHDGVSLRLWLKFGENNRNKVKSLHIFKQIVDAVSDVHSKGTVLLNLCPSYFKLLQSNEVTYIGSTVQIENISDQGAHDKPNYQNEKRPMESSSNPEAKRNKLGENPKLVISEPQSPNRSGVAAANENDVRSGGAQWNAMCNISNPKPVHVTESDISTVQMSDSSKLVLGSANNKSEEAKWYASPEEFNKRPCILPSNIYSLGILLVELLSAFDSERGRGVAMFNLRNRILPPDFLAENPEEARLCFWLLHPEPSFRPSIREIVESDVIKDIEDLSNSSSSFNHDDIDQSELLLHFLHSLQQHKHDRSSKLIKEITLLENDIEEVNKRRRRMSFSPEDLVHAREEVPRESSSGVNCNKSPQVSHEEMLVKNLDQLEKTYFSMRSNVGSSSTEPIRCDFKEMCSQETSYQAKNDGEMKKSTDDLGAFYNGLGKYARYTKFKVCATLSTENLYNLNIISSLSFDPNEDYFAVAGVSKKIKIHNFHAVLDNTGDGQYPVMQMSNNSKLSCTCWNNNISNCLASSDYDGAVKLWDTETGKEVSRYTEHSKRAWSVDFSQVSPTKLASGGDDCSVKLWDTNQKSSAMSIRIISPVCCVQFHSKSSNLLAFGASNSHTYCMDLRNTKKPWCMLVGHANPVSYIKFLDSETAISASTDSTLKIWDLNKRGSCISTLAGHTNKKIFVGLSVTDDGYIMCGSETNEVFAYHRSFSMPITSHKFSDDEDGHFVSAVCSRKQSELMVAANSTGSIKVLQMV